MYCGDDVEAVVGDVGTSLSKFGLAGEDTPSLVVPTVVARRLAAPPKDDSAAAPSPPSPLVVGDFHALRDVELLRPIRGGAVTDWDAMETLWAHAFTNLRVDPKEHPVIASMPACVAPAEAATAASDRERYMEMMFEKFDVPCFYMAKDAVLDAFAFGRSAALVCEIGAGATRVVPVFDGYPLERPAQYSTIGCDRLSEYLAHLVRAAHPTIGEIRPRCCYARKVNALGQVETALLPESQWAPPTMPASYLAYMRHEVYRDMREAVCTTAVTPMTEERLQQLHCEEQRYELPDGQVLTLGRERFQVSELLLHPHAFEDAADIKTDAEDPIATSTSTTTATTTTARATVPKGLPKMHYDAVQLCDGDLRREMLGNVLLCGGGSLVPGLPERLHAELTALVPSSFKVRITTVMKVERQFSCFIGGSILASLGSFQQLWVSRREYDEVGAARLCAERLLS